MEVPKIEKLDELLRNYLGHETTIIDHETNSLLELGENYGSQILLVKIHVKKNDQLETLEAVAKLPPPGEFLQKMFNTPITFKNEIDFYRIIVPELEAFVCEKGLDGFVEYLPEFLGARLSLDPGKNVVDDGAVLLMKNLKLEGYEMVDRITGFDFETSKLMIKAVAKSHAVPLALKISKPELFQKKIRPLFQPYNIFEIDEATSILLAEKFKKIAEASDSCKQYAEKVESCFKAKLAFVKNSPNIIREPFATVVHTDTWINNFMLKFRNGVPVSTKIVDYQLAEYGSPLRDVILFIFTSVQIPVIQEHCDDLIELYHQTLVEVLVKLGCDLAPFSLEEVYKELKLVAEDYEFIRCLMMLQPVYAVNDSLKELDQYDEKDLTSVQSLSPKYKERAEFIVQEFVKRGWI